MFLRPLPLFALVFTFLARSAFAGDVQVTFQKHTQGAVRGKATEGNVAQSSETVGYTISLANTSLKETEALEVRYIIFIERQRIGDKKGLEQVEKVKGRTNAEALKPRGRGSVETEPVKLKESALQGSYHYPDGGRMKAQDSVKGLWIKVFQGDKLVGEYANPSTLATKEKWEE